MRFQRRFRRAMCTLCALIFVLNSRGPQPAAAEWTEESPATPPPAPRFTVITDSRLRDSRPELDVTGWPFALYGYGRPVTEEPAETVRVGGIPVDARIADELRAMISDARAAGLSVYLSCGYTDAAAQEHIYRRTAAKYGEFNAQTIVDRPNESEHRSGLAVDIADRYYEEKDSSLENTELFAWLRMHCSEYGFILRYPKGAKLITGHVYEPWHFRYVGAEAAAFITENGLTLEEFLELYRDEGDGV